MNEVACLESIAIQLLDGDVHVRLRTGPGTLDFDPAPVDAPEPAFADHEAAAEAAGGRFQLGEGEDPQIIGPALSQEILEQLRRVRPVPPRLGVELGPPRVQISRRHAQRPRPRHLARYRPFLLVVAAAAGGEVEAFHPLPPPPSTSDQKKEMEKKNGGIFQRSGSSPLLLN